MNNLACNTVGSFLQACSIIPVEATLWLHALSVGTEVSCWVPPGTHRPASSWAAQTLFREEAVVHFSESIWKLCGWTLKAGSILKLITSFLWAHCWYFCRYTFRNVRQLLCNMARELGTSEAKPPVSSVLLETADTFALGWLTFTELSVCLAKHLVRSLVSSESCAGRDVPR